MAQVPQVPGSPIRQLLKPPQDLYDLFAEAFVTAERLPPGTPFDHAWHRAAVSLLQGMVETGPQRVEHGPGGVMLVSASLGDKGNYLRRMGNRLEPEVATLARAELDEAVIATMVNYNLPTLRGKRTSSSGVVAGGLESSFQTALEGAMSLLASARKVASTREEASVRLGLVTDVRNKKGDTEAALALFRDVEQTGADPWALYLAHLFEGRVLEGQGQLAEAGKAYASALAVIPDAQSGHLALASVLFVQGDAALADTHVEAALASPRSKDPWELYPYGDYRNWPVRLAALRESLK